jgi:hypothetical protein
MSSRPYRASIGVLSVLCAAAATAVVAGQPPGAPYAGQQARSIKALSDQERSALLAGQGSGFAKAAELNGYPGPAHVLELAAQLHLDASQRAGTEALMADHRRRAREIGADLIAAEAELDGLFADRRARAESVDATTQKVATVQARLRAEHLKTHLLQTALLTPEQIERYASLRGYRRHDGKAHRHP